MSKYVYLYAGNDGNSTSICVCLVRKGQKSWNDSIYCSRNVGGGYEWNIKCICVCVNVLMGLSCVTLSACA